MRPLSNYSGRLLFFQVRVLVFEEIPVALVAELFTLCVLKQAARMMKMLKTLYDHKRQQERSAMRERAAQHQKQLAHIEASRAVKRKERAKHAFYKLGQMEKRQDRDEL